MACRMPVLTSQIDPRSQDFADKGYGGGSHGCSQLRDYQVAKWLYEQVKVGDRVVVY